MAADSAVTYLGRENDMMNTGGYRVSLLEVEAARLQHPAITDTAAFVVTAKTDTTLIAAVYCAGTPIDHNELVAFATGRLARYKRPKIFIHSPALPRGANGKILRPQLRQDFEAPHGQA